MCSFLPWKGSLSRTVYPHLAKTFSFLSQPRLQKGKPYLCFSSLTFRWFSFFLLSLHACWTSWFHVLVGQLHSYIRGHRFKYVYFSHLGKTFTPCRHPWTHKSVPKFFSQPGLWIFFYISASSRIHAHCGNVFLLNEYSTIHLSILLSMLLWLALLMICFAITNAAAKWLSCMFIQV